MMPRTLLLLLGIFFMPGCSGETPAPVPSTPATSQVETPAKEEETATTADNSLPTDAEHHVDVPQEPRPADGALEAETRVTGDAKPEDVPSTEDR